MNLRSASIGLLLALCASTGFAGNTSYCSWTLEVTDPTEPVPLGFGRSGESIIIDEVAPKPLGMQSLRSFAPQAAFTPGTLPFDFHDIWQFNGLPPGTYSFVDTTLTATGNMAFGTVSLEWYLPSTGQLKAIDFSISPDLRTATGSGTFTIESSCAPKGCLFVDIRGWSDSAGGYLGSGTVTAVPEPAAGALMLAGLALLGGLARRRLHA